MPRLTIMKGLPASGKSTRAHEIMKEQGNTVRVNADLLRTMLHFDKFTGPNERITNDVMELLVDYLYDKNLNVIIDNTNLNPDVYKKWKEKGHKLGAKIHTEVMDTDVSECLIRDGSREKSVGAHVIYRMAFQHKRYMDGQKVIICDLDGTLADLEHRRHFVAGKDKKDRDWHGFFEAMDDDTLREDVAAMVMAELKPDVKLILVSARPEKYRERTMNWLAKQGQLFPHDFPSFVTLLMRPDNDSREDSIVKKEIYEKYLKHLDIVKVFDDRPRVIRMWRELGLEVEDVGTGEEF